VLTTEEDGLLYRNGEKRLEIEGMWRIDPCGRDIFDTSDWISGEEIEFVKGNTAIRSRESGSSATIKGKGVLYKTPAFRPELTGST